MLRFAAALPCASASVAVNTFGFDGNHFPRTALPEPVAVPEPSVRVLLEGVIVLLLLFIVPARGRGRDSGIGL